MNPEQPQQNELPERERLAQEITKRWRALIKASPEEAYDETTEFAQKLQKKYPDCDDYRLYHILAGSTPMPERPCSRFDFPGEDSVEKFIESLEEKYKA